MRLAYCRASLPRTELREKEQQISLQAVWSGMVCGYYVLRALWKGFWDAPWRIEIASLDEERRWAEEKRENSLQ